jgi:hypothetical protein
MKRTIICALFAAMICTFCITQQAVADEPGKTIGLSEQYASQAGAGGSRQIELLDSPGGGFNTLSGARSRVSAADAPAIERARLEEIGPEMFKVLSVIGHRTGDRKLLEKVKYKLSTMSNNRLRLAVSLSERAADDSHGVRTDIAFFLLTTLIVFS